MNIVEFIQASHANYTAGRGGRAIDGMAVHYTATSAGAHNNLVYFSRPGAQTSAHLFVDKDGSIRQSVRLEDTAWAVGNFAEIYAHPRATYGITRVIRHYDVTDKRCPAPHVDADKWAALKSTITGGAAAVSGGGSGGAAPSGSTSSRASTATARSASTA